MGKQPQLPAELLPGSLDMLILRTLSRGPSHGYRIAQHIQQASAGALAIGEGSLYPSLQRLLLNGWAEAEWGVSETNRRIRIYRITDAGKKRLAEEVKAFDATVAAILRVLEAR